MAKRELVTISLDAETKALVELTMPRFEGNRSMAVRALIRAGAAREGKAQPQPAQGQPASQGPAGQPGAGRGVPMTQPEIPIQFDPCEQTTT